MNVSVLVPYRPDGGWRDRLWEWNRRRWAELCPGVELVVGSYFGDPDGPFNAGRAINVAGDQATGDLFVTVAADFLPDPDVIARGVEVCRSHPWAPLWTHTGFLTRDCTEQLLAGADVAYRYEQFAAVNNAGHIVRRDVWFDVGGVDERFEGWGPEDLAFRDALSTLHGVGPTVPGTCIHLWHPRRETGYEAAASQRNHGFYRDHYRPAVGNPTAMRAVVEAAKATRC